MSILTKLIAAVAFAGWMNTAQATLIFDFELRDDTYFLNGSIHGLVDNLANQQATHITIGNNNMRFSLNTFIHFRDNNIDVFNGVITQIILTPPLIGPNGSSRDMVGLDDGSFYTRPPWALARNIYDDILIDADNNFELKMRVDVPEPHTALLVILGLAGLGFSRHKKQH